MTPTNHHDDHQWEECDSGRVQRIDFWRSTQRECTSIFNSMWYSFCLFFRKEMHRPRFQYLFQQRCVESRKVLWCKKLTCTFEVRRNTTHALTAVAPANPGQLSGFLLSSFRFPFAFHSVSFLELFGFFPGTSHYLNGYCETLRHVL
jgi:hypothetical protein